MIDTNHQEIAKPLAQKIMLFANKAGDITSHTPELTLHIRNAPTDPLHCIYTLSLAVVLQGAKMLSVENSVLPCSGGQTMLTTFDLPVVSHVTEATRHQPFVAMVLKLDYNLILQTAAELKLPKLST